MWMLALFLFLLSSREVRGFGEGQLGPVFIQEPPHSVDFLNSTGASVLCSAHGSPSPVIHWVLSDGTRVNDIPGMRKILHNGTLVFLPFPAEEYDAEIHSAIYMCVASNNVGRIVSRKVHVRAVVKQYYEVQVYDEYVVSGNTAVLKCHIPSFVRDYVIVTSWLRGNKQRIISDVHNGGRYSVFATGELHIRHVDYSDGGPVPYRCETRHTLTGETWISGMAGKVILTDAQSSVPPRVTDTRSIVTVRQKDPLEIPCAAQGFPIPTYEWFIRGNSDEDVIPVELGGRMSQVSGSLYLAHSVVEDSGLYMCLVNNSVGSERIYTSIVVTSTLSAYISPQSQTVDVGETALFNCTTDGHPQDNISWLKDGKPVEGMPRIKFLGLQVLMIEPVVKRDRGMYQCIVSNTEESAQGSAQLRIGNSPPLLISTFRNETLHPGKPWFAKCEASGVPLPDIAWKLDNETLSVNRRVTISNRVSGDSVISYVNISSLQLEDGGYYMCVATNKMGSESYGAVLHIYGPPHIKPMPDYSVIAGKHAEFHCSVVGYPISDIRWEKDGRGLPENHRQIVHPNGTLVIRDVQKYSDQGGYVCAATSPSGQTAKRKFNVVVMEAPVIDPFKINQKLQYGMRMHLTCVVSKGDFPVIIRWLKDDKLIDSSLNIAERALDEYSSTLIFSSLSTTHTGNYTCEASNSAAVTTYTASIVVHVPPTWIIEPIDSEVIMGRNISIHCSADGLPSPEIHWKKSMGLAHAQYKELHQVMKNYMFRTLNNGSLIIFEVRPEDRGYYLCHANNGVEGGLSKVIFLTVHVPARFASAYKNVTAIRGSEAMLECMAEGDKPISIAWYREGRRFDASQHSRAKVVEEEVLNGMRSLLSLRHVRREDTSYFECLAKNKYGSERMEIQLLVQEPPEPPHNIRVVNFSSRSANLSWEAPYDGNSPITVYVIQYKNSSDTWQGNVQHVTVGADQSAARIPTLQPASSYEFRVLAENSVGSSNLSESVLVNTLEEVPGGPPTDVRVKARNSETLVVTWKPPEHHLLHGEILGYYIGYRKNNSAEPYLYKTLEVTPRTELEIVLTGLQKFTQYIVLVQSYNRAGAGPRSEEVVTTTEEDVPGAPPTDVQCSVVTPQGITVSWTPPPPSEINGILLGYKVLYKAITDWGDSTPPLEMTTQSGNIELLNLQKFCNYSIEVRAYTRKGAGVSSRPLICRTQEDLPSEPAGIKAVVMDKETVLLSWKPPRFPNGILTKYKVYLHPLDDQGLAKDSFEVPAQETYYTITHLIMNHRYEFWVTAYTIIGQGPPSRHIVQSPSIYIPAKIASFSDIVVAAWREQLHLHCLAVGDPFPERHWIFNGKPLTDDSRVRVNSAGTLIISSLQSSDAGNYTCTVENKHNKEEITYNLAIRVPSTPYSFMLASSTTSSITLQWRPGQSLGNTILGYYLNFKREFGEWEKIKLAADKSNYTLDGLQCGTKYQFFLRAFNQLGMSNPTDILPTRTQGSAPIVPEAQELIRVNSTSISLDLGSWRDGGCPITSLVVEYKLRHESQWTLVSNNIKFEQVEFSVLDLYPETWYTLRMTAHNSAGSSVVHFDFVTLTMTGATVPPDMIMNSSYGDGGFYNDPGMVISIVAGILTVVVAIFAACYYYRKKTEEYATENYADKCGRTDVSSETSLMNMEKKSCIVNSGGSASGIDGEPSYLPTPMRVSLGQREDISPYATFRLPMAGGEGSGASVGAVPIPDLPEPELTHRQYVQHAQHCEKLQHFPVPHDSSPVDLNAPYASCSNSVYTKIKRKQQQQQLPLPLPLPQPQPQPQQQQYPGDDPDWIPMHSLYQVHRY